MTRASGLNPSLALVLPDVPSEYFHALLLGPSLPQGCGDVP